MFEIAGFHFSYRWTEGVGSLGYFEMFSREHHYIVNNPHALPPLALTIVFSRVSVWSKTRHNRFSSFRDNFMPWCVMHTVTPVHLMNPFSIYHMGMYVQVSGHLEKLSFLSPSQWPHFFIVCFLDTRGHSHVEYC